MGEESSTQKDLGFTDRMGPLLREEVTRQLLHDFQHYTPEHNATLTIDWSDTCIEGHPAYYLDGWLDNWSGVKIVDEKDEMIAWGWMDFIYVGGDNPLFVFWCYLHFGDEGEDVVKNAGIPQHIWEILPAFTRDLLAFGIFGKRWHNDSNIIQWRNQRSQL